MPRSRKRYRHSQVWRKSTRGSRAVNPKILIGSRKVPIHLFPPAGVIYGALAMKDGAVKYSPYNWRTVRKVLLLGYVDAILRHALAIIDGEDLAQDSGLPHVAHIIASGAILADAAEGGFLEDDRPVKGPAPALLERYREKK